MAHHRQGAPIVDCHDSVLPGERCHIVIIEFHALREGPQDHEILHHAAVPELVLDGVHMIWASLLEEPLKVVCRQPHLVLAATYGSPDAHHVGAAYLLAVATIVFGHGCDNLKTLLVPLLATLDALGVLDGDVG
jgi:hypothetical protein